MGRFAANLPSIWDRAARAVDEVSSSGCAYIHTEYGRASHVLLTMRRFEEIIGHDPGHDDAVAHIHVVPSLRDRAASPLPARESEDT
jgi:hypothetical protein